MPIHLQDFSSSNIRISYRRFCETAEFSDFIKIKKVPLDTRFLKHESDYVDENDEDYFFDTCEEVPLRTMKEVLDILEEG